MARREELERLSSEELHDLAVRRAAKRLDAGFFWRLFATIPAAEGFVGDSAKAETEVDSLLARIDDLSDSGKGDLADALRPLYLEYLEHHPERS